MNQRTNSQAWMKRLQLILLFTLQSLLGTGEILHAGENAAKSALSPDGMPRYRFEMGQELVYERTSDEDLLPKSEEDAKTESRSETQLKWWVWITKQNEDGSWRVLIRKQVKSLTIPATGEPQVRFENDMLGYCDLAADGSFATNPTLGGHVYFKPFPDELFVRLPKDEEALRDGWQSSSPLDESQQSFRATKYVTDLIQVSGPTVRSSDRNYLSQNSLQADFDTRRGLVVQRVSESKADWPVNPWHYRWTVALTSASSREAHWIDSLSGEADAYFAARARWDELWKNATRARTQAAARVAVDEAREVLVAAKSNSKLPEVQAVFDASLKLHDRDAEDEVEAAAEREELYAKAPLDWETTDFGGQAQRQVDYRGKVVLLDFWYRGCGHCIEALPKIKKLAARFERKDFVVLGMNIDQNDEDARHVIDTFELRYPNLRGGEIPKQYGVNVWPTFIVLDQTGRIADYHEGNTDDLYDHIVGVVDELLANPPSAE